LMYKASYNLLIYNYTVIKCCQEIIRSFTDQYSPVKTATLPQPVATNWGKVKESVNCNHEVTERILNSWNDCNLTLRNLYVFPPKLRVNFKYTK
jgi:hypothetical protein